MTAFYEAFLYDDITGHKEWVGTADLETIEKFGLAADLRYPYYGEKTADGWGCRR